MYKAMDPISFQPFAGSLSTYNPESSSRYWKRILVLSVRKHIKICHTVFFGEEISVLIGNQQSFGTPKVFIFPQKVINGNINIGYINFTINVNIINVHFQHKTTIEENCK
jgi:hypothetical protein